MTISKDLFLAILSLDSYNRGYGAGIAFHPALFLIVTSWIASWARRFKPRMLPCRGATSTAAVFPPLISQG
jgi:hypothetical protein